LWIVCTIIDFVCHWLLDLGVPDHWDSRECL